MTTMEQMKENIALFQQADPVNAEEKEVLSKVLETVAEVVPCTTCRYCVDACPQKLDIP
jgi:predicted aldo/keto reductase-like oxidoreductase